MKKLVYDLGFIFCGNKNEKVLFWIKHEARRRNLSFLWINEHNAADILKKIQQHRVKINFLIDNESNYFNPTDLYMHLCYAVKDTGGKVVDDPDDARSYADKSVTHYDLLEAGLPVPYTVVVRNWMPDDFVLTKEQLKKLGKPFIIKPATGFGQKGVVRDASGDIKQIAEARHFNRGDNFLLQKKIVPARLGNRMAWFRVYYLFGEVIPCFWHTDTGAYQHVTMREFYEYKLLPLAEIVFEVADIVRLNFFSTEIALTGEGGDRRFVVIDYVNDQCELCVRPPKMAGPVPEVIDHIAEVFVRMAWVHKIGKKIVMHRTIRLADGQEKRKMRKKAVQFI